MAKRSVMGQERSVMTTGVIKEWAKSIPGKPLRLPTSEVSAFP